MRLRRIIGAVALAGWLGACGGSDPSSIELEPDDVTTTSAMPAPDTAPPDPTTTVAPTGEGGGEPPTTLILGGPEALPAPKPAPPPPPPTTTTLAVSAGGPGAAAPLFLRPAPATRLVVQVRSQAGAEPLQATLDHLAAVLRDVSGKQVRVVGGDPVAAGDGVWTDAELRSAADAGRLAPAEGTAVIRFLYVRGRAESGEDTVGIAVSSDVAAVFSDQVAGPGFEDAVTIHELGHLLGLVDLVVKTGRADPEHPGHSSNRRSVMYWAVETTLLGDILAGGPPRDFDAADLADLTAIRRG